MLIFFGIGVAVLISFSVAPRLIPDDNELQANIDLGMVQYTVGQGDLFVNMPNKIAEPTDPYLVLSEHRLAWDEDGFRFPAQPSENYEIIALGDSYTEASNVGLPWSDVLAETLDEPVRNLGFRGYGPVEYAKVMETYGQEEHARIIVIGFFGGNDIANAGLVAWGDEFILPAIARLDALGEDESESQPWVPDSDGPYRYPIQVDLNGTIHDIVFFDGYLWFLNMFPDDFLNSINYERIEQSLDRIVELADEDACVLLTYFPSKPQVYLPFVVDEDSGIFRGDDATRQVVPQQGRALRHVDDPDVDYEKLLQRRSVASTVVGDLANRKGIHYLDLTPTFVNAAADGAVLYYTYDTHWNQAGHDLAGQTIAEYISAGNCSSR